MLGLGGGVDIFIALTKNARRVVGVEINPLMIEAVDHPGCQLHLDVFAMSSEEEPIADIIRAHGAHLAHFHANDTSMGGPGSGDVDYAPIVDALRGVDYRGYVSVEVFDMTPGGPAIAKDSLAFLRSVFEE